ncbi:hypothetical protein ACJZ2D_016156 [Fusarium nematophilum]
MITLLSPHYVLQEVTEDDMVIASLAWGFTIGFGWLTTWTATKQTRHIYKNHRLRVFRNAYVWMIWLEILVCLIFSIICWLHLKGYIPPSFAFYFTILTTWALQVYFTYSSRNLFISANLVRSNSSCKSLSTVVPSFSRINGTPTVSKSVLQS